MSWFDILKEDDADDWNYDWKKEEKLRAKKRNKKLIDEGVHARTSTRWLNDDLSVWDDTKRYGEDYADATGHQPKPLKQYNAAEFMLFDIFNVPIEILGQLNIPDKLVRYMKKESNLDKLDEQKFNELMELSEERKYQPLVDKLIQIFDL